MANGWTGNILRVNLTTGNITLEDSSKFKSFVGGMGFGYKIMYDEVPPGTKPFDEANKLVFATGPLTGSGAPCSSRSFYFMIMARAVLWRQLAGLVRHWWGLQSRLQFS